MKKLYTSISIVLFFSMNAFAQEEMVAGWTFPGNALAADTGVAANLTQEIYTVGGTSEIELKNGFDTKAAQASEWHEGMDEKGWVVELNTVGFSSLTISSRQQSGGNDPGPKFFKIQYSTNGGSSWTDLEGGDITVENDWETSFVDQLPLPEECENLEQLMVRWLMAFNEASGSGGIVQENGKSKIDEIYIRGEFVNGFPEAEIFNSIVFQKSGDRILKIKSTEVVHFVTVTTLEGKYWKKQFNRPGPVECEVPASFSGKMIVCAVYVGSNKTRISRKLFLP